MDYKKIFLAAAVFLLLLLFFFITWSLFLKSDKDKVTKIIVKSDTMYVKTIDTVEIEKWYHEPSRIDTFIVFENNMDTLYITGIARDTLWIDSLQLNLVGAYPVITDSVFIENTITKTEKFSFYAGADVGMMKEWKPDVGIRLGITTGRHSVEAGYDFLSKRAVIGYRFKIIRKIK